MSTFDVIVRIVHVVCAAVWLGAAIFVGWFLMPAVIEAGPDRPLPRISWPGRSTAPHFG